MPKVSVVVPTFKHSRYVLEALDSVFAQTFEDFEVIVINDGSPDDTEKVLAPLITSGAVKYHRQANSGQAAARNRGIALATGELIALLDDDDAWPPEKLQAQVQILDQNPHVVLAYGDVAYFTDDSPHTRASSEPTGPLLHPDAPSGDVLTSFLHRNWIVSPGQTLIRRSALELVGGFDREVWGADDYDLYLRLARIGAFEFLPCIALHYRLHEANASRDLERMYSNLRAIHAKHLGRLPRRPNIVLWLRSRLYLHRWSYQRFFEAAGREEQGGCGPAARRLLFRGAQIYPPGLLRRSFWRRLTRSLLRSKAHIGTS